MSERVQTIIKEIGEAHKELVDLALSLDGESLARPTCNEGWCVKDVIAHLACSEAGLRRLAVLTSKGESTVRPGFDLHAHNRQQVELRRERSVEDLIAEMAESRAATLSFLVGVSDNDLDKVGQLSSGAQLTVEQVIQHVAEHERQHTDEIKQAIAG